MFITKEQKPRFLTGDMKDEIKVCAYEMERIYVKEGQLKKILTPKDFRDFESDISSSASLSQMFKPDDIGKKIEASSSASGSVESCNMDMYEDLKKEWEKQLTKSSKLSNIEEEDEIQHESSKLSNIEEETEIQLESFLRNKDKELETEPSFSNREDLRFPLNWDDLDDEEMEKKPKGIKKLFKAIKHF